MLLTKNEGQKKKMSMIERVALYAAVATAIVGTSESIAGAKSGVNIDGNKKRIVGIGSGIKIPPAVEALRKGELKIDVDLSDELTRSDKDLAEKNGIVENADSLAATERAKRLAKEGFAREIKE